MFTVCRTKVTPSLRKFSSKPSPFVGNSVFDLVKTAAVYKASQADFILNKGDKIAERTYKLLGKELTNSIIENTGGKVFTAGPTIRTLISDVDRLYTEKGVWSGANYVLEGLSRDDPEQFNKAKDYLIETLDRGANRRHYCHLAIKLTGLGHMDMFKIYNKAQRILMTELFSGYATPHPDGRMVLTKEGVKQFMRDNEYEFTEADIQEFFEIAKFENSNYNSDEIGEVEFYENVHVHYVNSDNHNTAIIKKICNSVGLKSNTRQAIQRFQDRVVEIVEKAQNYDTKLFVDAEQTFIQLALDAFTRQLQSIYHKDRVAFILNGYQSYLKSSPVHVQLEVERCKAVGIGFGIKLIRGAYMEEERKLANENYYPSPVWDTIEDTHTCYNQNVAHILEQLDPERGKSI